MVNDACLSVCVGAAAGAPEGPGPAGGAGQAAVQRPPPTPVRHPGQHGGALDPDQDGGEAPTNGDGRFLGSTLTFFKHYFY